jgi:twinfilin-like protein
LNTIALQSDFSSDLSQLSSLLSPTAARYVLLKIAPGESDGYVAVTYVPNGAPVREKMLFASTRLTLVRELGIERFRETLFATEAAELTAEGWAKHEKHSTQAAPLTQEEEGQADLREAEAQESGGTTARKGHVGSKLDAIKTEDGLDEKLGALMQEGSGGLLVQLVSTNERSVQPDVSRWYSANIACTVLRPPRRDPPRRILHALRLSCPAGQHLVADRPAPQLLLLPW